MKHRWNYPRAYCLPRGERPATCECGATLHYEKREVVDRSERRVPVEDMVVTLDGVRMVNLRHMPPCSREGKGKGRRE